ncbi:MAG: glycosyltransferase family 2 protein [Bacteroidales bacterium]|nr:glycosyltransferase family 2 protein [Bacteroidales bacterium]MBK9358219.1 glycosyltransferase family 2 protein [Bacteroidales bacterium]
MKLIIQIPCFNEAKTLPEVIRDLPRVLPGISEIEYLVIDDGSIDNTVSIAHQLKVDHVLQLGSNRGLAYAFSEGIKYALEKDADIVVNTDGDNQYVGEDIALLVQPIVDGKADVVVGCRPILAHKEFSPVKKLFQLMGSWILRKISKTDVKDAPSGFRAFSREACLRIFIYSKFSYTMENLIQAGNSNQRVHSVDIRVNAKTRESRLFRNIFEHIYKSADTIIRMYILYRPGRFFLWIGNIFNLAAAVLGIRFVYLLFITDHPDKGRTYIPSLILLAILAFWGVVSYMIGILGELLKFIRKQNEEILGNQRREKFSKKE